MSEKFPQPDKKLIDRRDKDDGYGDLFLEYEKTAEGRKERLEDFKPVFEDFFNKVISEQPDYLILMDKGARPFGVPFHKYLKDLHLQKTPKILFWNDGIYKDDVPNGKEDQLQRFTDDFLKPESKTSLLGKKVFLVDEIFDIGRNALSMQKVMNTNLFDGHYFAMSVFIDPEKDSDPESHYPKLRNDSRFTIYGNNLNSGSLFPKHVANLYVVDKVDEKTGRTETKRRFQFVDADGENIRTQEQRDLRKERRNAEGLRNQITKDIYNTLLELPLTKKD